MKWGLDFLKDKKTILFMALLLAVLAFIGKLSAFGFVLSEHLAASPKTNYAIRLDICIGRFPELLQALI